MGVRTMFPTLLARAYQLTRACIKDREAVFPTRQSLGAMNNKLKGAQTGHSLLKRKSEALTKYLLLIHPYPRS